MKTVDSFLKNHRVGVIIALLIVTLVWGGTLWFMHRNPQPADLGTQLEYVGKRDFGCQFPLMFFFCDGEPSTEYYFATDLDEQGLQNYFKHTKFSEENGGVGAGYSFKYLVFTTSDGDFNITFYNNTSVFDHKKTNKTHIISLVDKDYVIASRSFMSK